MNEIVVGSRGLAPANLTEAMAFAKMLSESDMVPKQFKGRPGDIIVAAQFGMELGLSWVTALQSIAAINGRPAVWGDGMLGMVRASAHCEDVIETLEGEGDQMVAVCVAMRRGCSPVRRTFSVADAKKAGLWNKRGRDGQETPWVTYPTRMLQMRARGFALRDAFADVLRGIALAEELMDMPPEKEPPIRATVSLPELTATPSADVNRGHDGAMPKVAKPEAPAPNGISKTIGPKERGLLGAEAGRKSEECGVAKEIILRRALVAAGGVWSRNDLTREKMSAVLDWIRAYDPTQDGAEMPVAPSPDEITF